MAEKIDLTTRRFTVPEIRFLMGELTQEEFGRLIGLTQFQVFNRETGRAVWNIYEMSAISEVSGIPLERIAV